MRECELDTNTFVLLLTHFYVANRQVIITSAEGGYYVAAKATYIRLLHGKIGIFWGFFGLSSVHRSRTHIVLG